MWNQLQNEVYGLHTPDFFPQNKMKFMSEGLFRQWNNGLGDANNKIHGLKQPCPKPFTEEIRWLGVFWKWLDVVNFVCSPKERAMMAKRTLRQEKHAINLKEGLRERNQYTAKDLPSTLFSLIQSCAFACSLYSTYDFVQLCWWWAMLGLPTAVFTMSEAPKIPSSY